MPDLRLLSGHQKEGTLRRYLGWDVYHPDAEEAARRRFNALSHPSQVVGSGQRLPLGIRSGIHGVAGRQVPEPTRIVPLQPPSSFELGLDDARKDGPQVEDFQVLSRTAAR